MGFMRTACGCLAVLGLCACARHEAAVPAPADTSAGVRIYIDPATGEARSPDNAELAADAARRRQSGAASVKVAPEVVVTPLPGGITEYNLGTASQVDETTCLQKDGKLGECSEVQKAALRAVPEPGRK